MKKKKTIKVKNLLILIGLVLAIVVACWYFFFRDEVVVVRVVDSIKNYDYTLKNTDKKIYKTNYEELKTLLEDETRVDEENYVKLISKLFIIDFYTLNNKTTNQDIGGVQYVHSSLKQNFIDKASSSVYKYVKNNIDGKRKQELPEVIDVEILSIDKVNYKNKNTDYNDSDAFEVKVKIDYKKDLDYIEEQTLVFIHENEHKLGLVEIKSEEKK